MKTLTLSTRTAKEILRDPLNFAFGLGFPVVLLLLLTVIQKNIPVSLFELDRLAPGVSMFGLSFLTLFSASLISKDRSSSLLQRLYTAPLSAKDFILSYTLPVLPIGLGQTVICYAVALALGLKLSVHILTAILFSIPTGLFFIFLGLLCGSIFNDKQVGGLCGALLTNLTGWLSGVWFDLSLLGGTFKKIAYALPFAHAADMQAAALSGSWADACSHLWWVLAYMLVTAAAATVSFLAQMRRK